MEKAGQSELPFSARYSLPVAVSQNLGEVSWEHVVEISTDFRLKTEGKESRVKKVAKELHLARILLLEKIRHASAGGRVDPALIVETVRLIERCEAVADEYALDLGEFSRFLYLVSEKLKKEKLARHEGDAMGRLSPMKDEIAHYKERSEGKMRKAAWKKRGR